jgi:hypothetical protein
VRFLLFTLISDTGIKSTKSAIKEGALLEEMAGKCRGFLDTLYSNELTVLVLVSLSGMLTSFALFASLTCGALRSNESKYSGVCRHD